jgi:ABC-type antimicrobial peptide transport system permease subunit
VSLGVGLAYAMPTALGLGTAGLGVAVGLLAGAAASVLPALHASRRDPAAILRRA